MTTKEIGELIRTRRISRGMTQDQLADAVNVSPSTIAMYESGRRRPKENVVEALADVFNVPKWSILYREDEMTPNKLTQPDDDDVWAAREALRDDPYRKSLVRLARHGSAEDVRQVAAIIDALRATNPEFWSDDD